MIKKQIFNQLYIVSIVLGIVSACANPGTPTGGKKDETPPVIKESTPAPNSLNYKGKEVTITFDEIIQLKEVNQKLVVSPPLNKQPAIISRGDELLVTFDEPLQENTTYTLDFADAITDNNEGNVLKDFRFSFSTGTIVDSLSISGNVWMANDLSPANGVLVFIHENLADSAFTKLVPIRLAKTDAKGHFSINNIRPGSYRIYALDDANRDYKYDQPAEKIAWLDDIIIPKFEYKEVTDSIKPDSVSIHQKLFYLPDSLNLFLFQGEDPSQYLVKDERPEKACINLIFKKNLETLIIQPVDTVFKAGWSQRECSINKDSVKIWITDPDIYERDSITLSIGYLQADSLNQIKLKTDTITYYHFEIADKKKKKNDAPKELPSLQLLNLKSTIDLYSTYTFSTNSAITHFNPEGFHLFEIPDSIPLPINMLIEQDSLSIRQFIITYPWKPGGKYQLEIDSASLVDVYYLANKPIKQKFSIKTVDSYGTIYITIDNLQSNWIVQITNTSDVVLRQSKVPENGKIAFRYVPPGDYMFKIIVDNNKNNKWDSGDWGKKQKPEEVIYYPSKLLIRANWDQEVKWDPKSFNRYKFADKFRKNSSTK